MLVLYTLPHCPICHMIKQKLDNKKISYEEKDLSVIADKLAIDRAPVLEVEGIYLTSPTEMAHWISQ